MIENVILWTPAYTPGDGQTSWVYSTNPVLHLYISCYQWCQMAVVTAIFQKCGRRKKLVAVESWWP